MSQREITRNKETTILQHDIASLAIDLPETMKRENKLRTIVVHVI
jgi:hypothetical protein